MRRLLVALLLGLATAGCSWHSGLTAPPGVDSIGLDVFENQTLERDLEPRLAEALSTALSQFVAAPLVRPSRADAVVRGNVTSYRRRWGVRTVDNQLQETGVQIVVNASLVDRRSGAVLASTERKLWSNYGLSDTEADRRAAQRALENLADRVILDLFEPLDRPGGVD